MSDNMTDILNLIWTIFKDVSLFLWFAIPLIYNHFERRNTPWKSKKNVKESTFKEFDRLIKVLGEIQLWFASNESELHKKIRKSLWVVISDIFIQKSIQIVIHSKDLYDRERALRILSQQNDTFIKTVINRIAMDDGEPHQLRELAKIALQEYDSINSTA